MYKSLERTIMEMGRPKVQPIVEDGHQDVASAKNKVKIAMSALQKMQGELNKLSDEDDLPSWWMGKVAVAVDKIDGMADYLDTQVEELQLAEVEIRKADFFAHERGEMSLDDLAKKYNTQKGKISGELNLMRDHQRNNKKVFDRMEEVEIDEGMMKNMAIDLKDMPADEFQRKYNMSKAEAEKKFGKPEEKTLTPAEKKKREEVAQAISRDNPDMPMDKKMAIATATAKKVAEDIQTEPATNELLVRNFIQKLVKEMQ